MAEERAAAARHGVPLVARWSALASRPDLHPGAGIPPLLRLPADCVHRALAPGAFDAELVGVLRLLEGGGVACDEISYSTHIARVSV